MTKEKITLIATHLNADLDGLASMLAAQKIYSNSKIIFHHEGEKLLRRFFLQSLSYLFDMVPIHDLDNYIVERLVIVDTRQKSRLGKIAKLTENKNIILEIYDHHERSKTDLKASKDVFEKVGSTSTIMTNLLIEKNIEITPEEATVLSLGIYEDTGSFTFASTTRKDFEAAGYLREKGADLSIISNILSKELSPKQLTLLNDMIEGIASYSINNLNIIISTVSRNQFIPDLGFLTHKLNKMETCDAVFVAARMDDKIFLVGRSNTQDLNVGKILSKIGGGGHPFAGSATIKEKTLSQIKDDLIFKIKNYLQGTTSAKDLMSKPPIKISIEDTIEKASSLLTKYNINALLVTDDNDNLVGVISRQVVEKAKYHEIIKVPVKEYMNTDFMEVKEDSSITEVQKKIIENRQRLLPVKDKENRLTGVLTRTDLLHHIVTDFKESPFIKDTKLNELNARTRNVTSILSQRLPKEIFSLLQFIGLTADKTGFNAYVVGGFVRDLLLHINKNELDIDIVVEGDGVYFAKELAKALNAKISPHEKFKTAVITLSDGLKIDVATARTEFYSSPAALPEIEMSSLKLDLYRRDFTINTLAIQLNENSFGTLIDYFFAQKDLKDKAIRIIHNLSFVEDPTRIFRAIRFENRFGFRIGKFTKKLIKNAIDMHFFERLSGPRVFTELKYILKEEDPLPALESISNFNLFPAINKQLEFTKTNKEIIKSAKKVLNWFHLNEMDTKIEVWQVMFSVLIHDCHETVSKEICNKFKMPPKLVNMFVKERVEAELIIKWIKNEKDIKNSQIYKRLSQHRTETILYMLSITNDEKVKNIVVKYFLELKKISPIMTGKDLLKLGFKQGPLFGEVLNNILYHRLDDEIKTKKDEFDFAQRYL